MPFADDRSRAVFRAVADAVETSGSDRAAAMFDLDDGRVMTVVVLHTDSENTE